MAPIWQPSSKPAEVVGERATARGDALKGPLPIPATSAPNWSSLTSWPSGFDIMAAVHRLGDPGNESSIEIPISVKP